jgi:F-type H+-transporting ATPase subunit gamma
MALSLRQIRRRIRSVESTKKTTRAMEMVATSKRKRLQAMLGDADRYLSELRRLFGIMSREVRNHIHPLLDGRGEIKSTLVVVITSDTGLCGSYNVNILELLRNFLSQEGANGQFEFVTVGRHGLQYLKRCQKNIIKAFSVVRPQQIDELTNAISEIAVKQYADRKTDRVIFIYTKTQSLGSLTPSVATFLPIEQETKENTDEKSGYLLEPTPDEILEILIPEFVAAQIGQILKNAFLSEQSSRMMAMRQATENAEEVIDSLTLQRNKARQASITNELIEVVSGSRAQQN